MTTSYEIHPTIGIARLGVSEEYFVGPEPDMDDTETGRVDPPACKEPPASYRDATKKLLRQAARFRVFKCERTNGKLTSAEEVSGADIVWTVHVANTKASAETFPLEEDTDPAATTQYVQRNAEITDRPSLEIDSGDCAVTAAHDTANRVPLEGHFRTKPVKLGEAFTENGRLIVLGGHGRSECVVDPGDDPAPITDFANNDYWFDDTCDGTVKATIKQNGSSFDAVPAWVVVAPFDFAPQTKSFVSFYDVAYQMAVDRDEAEWTNALPGLKPTDFKVHILPLLERSRGYRWVNSTVMRADVADKHAAWRPGANPMFPLLADPTLTPFPSPGTPQQVNVNRAISLRLMFLRHMRTPAGMTSRCDNSAETEPVPREVKMPRMHNDDNDENEVMTLTPTQYTHIKNWACSNFTNLASGGAANREFLCEAMDRIALEACSGGPFYPGMEVPRIVADEDNYIAPFRFDPGKVKPGDITKGLAMPWQADFFDCQMDGDNAWWPATRPDKVIVMHHGLDSYIMADVLSESMEQWDAHVTGKRDMVDKWHQLGIVQREPVLKAPRVADGYTGPENPGVIYIEKERILPREIVRSKHL